MERDAPTKIPFAEICRLLLGNGIRAGIRISVLLSSRYVDNC